MTPAKRGCFCVLERRHSSLSLKDGHREWREYLPAKIVSVSRGGAEDLVSDTPTRTDTSFLEDTPVATLPPPNEEPISAAAAVTETRTDHNGGPALALAERNATAIAIEEK